MPVHKTIKKYDFERIFDAIISLEISLSLMDMPVPLPRRELLPDGAFKETAKCYLELLREKNPEAFDSLHEKILEWKSKKRPSEFPDLLRDFAKDLNQEKDYLEEIAHALEEYFSKIHKENGDPFTIQIDENKIENEEDKILLLGAAKCLNEKYEKGLDKFIGMLVEAAADLVKNQEETITDLEGNHGGTLSNLLRP